MASVRLSQELRSKIQRASKLAYSKATREPTMDTATIETIWRGIVEHPTHIAFTNFVAEHGTALSDLYDRTIGQRNSDDLIIDQGQVRVCLKLSTSRKSWSFRDYKGHVTSVAKLHLTEAEKLDVGDKIKALDVAKETARNDANNYNAQIAALLESCNTLKQLLDTQPSMKEFVPEELIREMHKKVTRESQARERREIAKVDGDLINQVVLTSKLVA